MSDNPNIRSKSPTGDQPEDIYTPEQLERIQYRQNIPEYMQHSDIVKICPQCHRQSLMWNSTDGIWACIAQPACFYRDDIAMT